MKRMFFVVAFVFVLGLTSSKARAEVLVSEYLNLSEEGQVLFLGGMVSGLVMGGYHFIDNPERDWLFNCLYGKTINKIKADFDKYLKEQPGTRHDGVNLHFIIAMTEPCIKSQIESERKRILKRKKFK